MSGAENLAFAGGACSGLIAPTGLPRCSSLVLGIEYPALRRPGGSGLTRFPEVGAGFLASGSVVVAATSALDGGCASSRDEVPTAGVVALPGAALPLDPVG